METVSTTPHFLQRFNWEAYCQSIWKTPSIDWRTKAWMFTAVDIFLQPMTTAVMREIEQEAEFLHDICTIRSYMK